MSRSYSNIGGSYMARSRKLCVFEKPPENRGRNEEHASPSGLCGAIYLGDLRISSGQDAVILEFLYNIRESHGMYRFRELRTFASELKKGSDAHSTGECSISQAHVQGGFIYFTVCLGSLERMLYATPEDFYRSQSMRAIAREIRIREQGDEIFGFCPAAQPA